jgi:hypothetical protein
MSNFSDEHKAYADYLAKAQTIPQNTSADGNGGAFLVGKAQNALDIVANVGATAVAFADATTFSVKLQSSETEGGSYVDVATIFTHTAAAGSGAYIAGYELGRYTVSVADDLWFKVVFTTTDAAATGTLDTAIVKRVR